MDKRVQARHGVVCRLPGERFGYFGWPSVARMDDGTLVVASSGLRTAHVCPFGKTVLNFSTDEGQSWSPPQVINDTPLDDRDAGVLSLGGRRLLVSWFTSDTRQYLGRAALSEEERRLWEEKLSTWTDELVRRWLGSWVVLSEDGKTWSEPVRVPVSTPHGPIRLASGDLLYLGKAGFSSPGREEGDIMACRSTDDGRTWTELGSVQPHEGTRRSNYHEPHVVELQDGRLLGMIRFQYREHDAPATEQVNFSLFQTESADGGGTLRPARHGEPGRGRELGSRHRAARRRAGRRPGLPRLGRDARRVHLHRLLPEGRAGGEVLPAVDALGAALRRRSLRPHPCGGADAGRIVRRRSAIARRRRAPSPQPRSR